jgi:hypothetical protein
VAAAAVAAAIAAAEAADAADAAVTTNNFFVVETSGAMPTKSVGMLRIAQPSFHNRNIVVSRPSIPENPSLGERMPLVVFTEFGLDCRQSSPLEFRIVARCPREARRPRAEIGLEVFSVFLGSEAA